jgi:hypothetical protein
MRDDLDLRFGSVKEFYKAWVRRPPGKSVAAVRYLRVLFARAVSSIPKEGVVSGRNILTLVAVIKRDIEVFLKGVV